VRHQRSQTLRLLEEVPVKIKTSEIKPLFSVTMSATKCRFCLGEVHPDDTGSSVLETSFKKAIDRVFSFELKQDAILPAYTCNDCSQLVWDFNSYSLLVQKNQEALEQELLLTGESESNAEKEHIQQTAGVTIKKEPEEPSSSVELPAKEFPIKVEPPDDFNEDDQNPPATEEVLTGEQINIKIEPTTIITEASIGQSAGNSPKYSPSPDNIVEETYRSEPDEPFDSDSSNSSPPADNSDDESYQPEEEEHFQSGSSNSSPTTDNSDDEKHQSKREEEKQTKSNKISPIAECEHEDKKNQSEQLQQPAIPVGKNLLEKMREKIKARIAAHQPTFRCDTCDRNFSTEHFLKLHNDFIHVPYVRRKRIFPCNQCSRSFTHPTLLANHQEIHNVPQPALDTKSFRCNACGKSFSCANSLQTHHEVMHPAADGDRKIDIVCEECNRTFADRVQLKMHRRVHRTQQCPICKKMLRIHSMRQHIKSHEGGFRCDVCQKPFSNGPNLQRHKLSQHNPARSNRQAKPPANCTMCEICNKAIKKQHFDAHMAAHKGKYRCDVCEKTFMCLRNLAQHKRLHS
uniref:Protein krueppel n=1 Tax=Anopheles dirus TaxID=7168 RepID=A0A182NUS0_9DIPT